MKNRVIGNDDDLTNGARTCIFNPDGVFGIHRWIWRNSAMGWKAAHYMAGFLSAILATVVAINTKSSFLHSTTALMAASVSAGLSFLVTTMGAQERDAGLERAAWELEKAMAIYTIDSSVDRSELGKAESRGVDILGGGKAN